MSMIEQQVNKIRKVAKCVYLATDKEVADDISSTLNQAADTIEALSAKLEKANMERSEGYYNGGWILCDDRLPQQPKENPIFDGKPLELYLVSVKNTDYAFRAFWNGKFFADGFSKLQNVIAWQPLPSPYRP